MISNLMKGEKLPNPRLNKDRDDDVVISGENK
jgi:hypothetical protein